MEVKKNDIFTVKITDTGTDGEGIGRVSRPGGEEPGKVNGSGGEESVKVSRPGGEEPGKVNRPGGGLYPVY